MKLNFENLPVIVNKLTEEVKMLKDEIHSLKGNVLINETPISAKELCQRLHISIPTLIAMRKRNQIPFIKVRGQYRYDWAKILEILQNKGGKL